MTGKKETEIAWRHTSVVVRADIFTKAHEQGIDISHVCNKALADLLGLNFREQNIDDVPVPRPVIIAQNSPPAERKEHTPAAHPAGHFPVINADDPAASQTVRSAKRQAKSEPPLNKVDVVTTPSRKKEEAVLLLAADAAQAGKAKKPTAGKAQKNEGLKKFVATKITRSDTVDAVVSKDEMYQTFTRFCNDHKYAPVPDRKAFTLALKNKFAFFDKTVSGIPSWVNVRLQ
ncbi:MAG: hypothetical protein Q7T80_07180 [Methanoregula sp.]|nr:hypothetical protein [Methanoregula sp.]